MFESLSRGWTLTKSSFKVLKLDKEIMLLPILSGLITILVTASLFVPLTAFGMLEAMGNAVWLVIFLFYVASYFVMLFFNAAVIECAMIRFNGGDPVVMDGLRKASSKAWRILQWALVAATVGLILKVLQSMARNSESAATQIIGQIAVWIAGAAWNVATYFVMPVLIYQDLSPGAAIKVSWTTWKRTWGEGFTATFATGIIFFLLGLLGLIPLFLGVMMLGSVPVAGIAFIGVAIVYWVVLWAANMAIDGIIVAALFKYAQDGRLPEVFQESAAVVPTGRLA